ncbi:DUF2975 domain-containing protein [Flavobacterium lindanitolerans]|uniref:DUF2975 domain-containing protein n=1 Tax=Flavobacterium lindanitolerans TaxID=428988 RepID=UPI00120AC508|nr:DUF2975 domain-containing protein [Flavobacterium lindanitolerans]MDQ7961892.1 DUF2975 domain-containing protein [Flavobacterium lindanitolerans]THD34046.1 MAG: DUF2975 domain-containing protein [Flavobacterium johnsoniae]
MEIKIGTKLILQVLHVLSWIIFLGLCFEAGALIVNAIMTLTLDATEIKHLWMLIDLSDLYKYGSHHYVVIMSQIIIVAVLKALMFYLIVKILYENKLDMAQPFNQAMGRFISLISYLALGIGFFSAWGEKYTKGLIMEGVSMPGLDDMHFDGSDVWLFMGIILLIIAQIFKRGIEIQTENDLTI